ncbi:MAG: MmpS family transport accessory protein [Mycobacterium sp.]
MSGPNPPDPGSEAEEPDSGQLAPEGARNDVGDTAGKVDPARTSGTVAYSQAYSAPESEQFMAGPYVAADPRLYDYDSHPASDQSNSGSAVPRWPWVVGVTVIVAAVALVVSVALLFARTETHELAIPATTTPSLPLVQDEITTTTSISTTTPPPPPPSPTSEESPPSSETPEPAPVPVEPPPPEPTTTAPVTTTTQSRPVQVTYSVTGTKAPFDQITITYVDASGQRRTQRNAYIPWSLTLTPISQSEVGSVEATSLLRLSKLNCSITSSDGTVLSSNSGDAPQTSC